MLWQSLRGSLAARGGQEGLLRISSAACRIPAAVRHGRQASKSPRAAPRQIASAATLRFCWHSAVSRHAVRFGGPQALNP